jgi:hypothetical protein
VVSGIGQGDLEDQTSSVHDLVAFLADKNGPWLPTVCNFLVAKILHNNNTDATLTTKLKPVSQAARKSLKSEIMSASITIISNKVLMMLLPKKRQEIKDALLFFVISYVSGRGVAELSPNGCSKLTDYYHAVVISFRFRWGIVGLCHMRTVLGANLKSVEPRHARLSLAVAPLWRPNFRSCR